MKIYTANFSHDGIHFEYATNAKTLNELVAAPDSNYVPVTILCHNGDNNKEVKYNYSSLTKAMKKAKDLNLLFCATIYCDGGEIEIMELRQFGK